jgi:oxygen-independent coproporphyrinogen-3 oxidase
MTAAPLPQDPSLAVAASNVPRYTSYPPANHFQPGIGAKLTEPFFSAIERTRRASLYIHIPYCDRLCWFCGCHTKQTLSYSPIQSYVGILCEELRLLRNHVARKPTLSRIHLGGGSPSLLRPAELAVLKQAIDSTFTFEPGCEISIEIDPSDVGAATIPSLTAFGMNRASIGVQDFDPEVQAAINRMQTYEVTRHVVEELRRNGVNMINIDILYGLPHQDIAKLLSTVDQVLSLRPQRIALFGYAHVPWVKPHQRLIPEDKLPGPEDRATHARISAKAIRDAGYVQIGIDHFALPGDSLAMAAQNGKLRRNFQGYTDDQSDILIGLGASALSKFPGGYLQNHVATGRYSSQIKGGMLAHDRGFAFNNDDKLRGWIIERLMCDFAFRRDDLVNTFGAAALGLWHEACALAQGELAKIVSVDNGYFSILETNRHLARHVASHFDAHLASSAFKYSKAV